MTGSFEEKPVYLSERVELGLRILDELSPYVGETVKPADDKTMLAITFYVSGVISENPDTHKNIIAMKAPHIKEDSIHLTKDQSIIFEALKLGRELLADGKDINGTRPQRVIYDLANQGLRDITLEAYRQAEEAFRVESNENHHPGDNDHNSSSNNPWITRMIKPAVQTIPIPGIKK